MKIETLRSNIDQTTFGTILDYLDNPETEIDYVIIVLDGDLTEKAFIAIHEQANKWLAMMNSGTVAIVTAKNRSVRDEAKKYLFDRNSLSRNQLVECLYVPPGYFIKVMG